MRRLVLGYHPIYRRDNPNGKTNTEDAGTFLVSLGKFSLESPSFSPSRSPQSGPKIFSIPCRWNMNPSKILRDFLPKDQWNHVTYVD